MALQVLTVGSHPNLAFYAWRLQATKACSVTVVSNALDPSATIRWQSSHLGNSKFIPAQFHQNLSDLDSSKAKYDVVILSVSNLQSFQDTCAKLGPFMHSRSLIVVESTGYVSLEPFVSSSYPKQKQVTVCSIMNEAEVKREPKSNEYSHRVLNSDQRIYLGTCTDEQKSLYKVGDSENYAKFYKLLQLVQEQSRGCVSLLKSNNYKEFMTYQWKLALPRIVLNPLSVIFEEPFPANLEKQILAKPLISGLVNEIFKIIKKMECKLIKGYENESNIMKNWAAHYPVAEAHTEPAFVESNSVFYNFYHRLDVDIDLLLLQPILLGDDHGVRTPYLENLYSIVCQLLKMNFADSLFFERKTARLGDRSGPELSSKTKEIDALSQDLASLKLEKETLETQFRERQAHVQQMENSLSQRQHVQDALVQKFEDQTRLYEAKLDELGNAHTQKEAILADLDANLHSKSSALKALDARIAQAEASFAQIQSQSENQNSQKQIPSQAQVQNQPRAVDSQTADTKPDSVKGAQTYDYSQMQTPDLSDLAHVAAYGDMLNGETPQTQTQNAIQNQTPQNPQIPYNPPRQTPHNSVSQAGAYAQHGSAASSGQPANLPDNGMSEKEKELHRREQAILERERELKNAYPGPGNIQQNEPYYDSQGGEQFYDVSGYQNQAIPPTNGGYAGHGNVHQNYRPSQSLTGNNPYNQPYEGAGYDQRPPHGLPANGFPQNSLPTTLRNPQRYQQNGPNFGNVQSQRPRMMSNSSQANNYPQNVQNMPQNVPQNTHNMQGRNMNQMGHPMQQSGSSQYLMNQPNVTAQNFSGTGKRSNRRSAFPDQALNIDYGGRGGMPMPTANGGKKHIQSSPPIPAIIPHKKPFGGNTNAQALGNNHLRVTQNTSSNSDSFTSHGSMAEDVPKPQTPDSTRDISIDVPVMEKAGKPLGGIAPTEEKKKKRGLFR